MPSFLCFGGKKSQESQVEKAFVRAKEAAARETVSFNKGIEQALIQKASKQPVVAPTVHVGSFPQAEFMMTTTAHDEEDELIFPEAPPKIITGTIHFHCARVKDKQATCDDGHTHNITGSGQTEDGTVRIEIERGSWSPSGYCFWVEKIIEEDPFNKNNKGEKVFVIHDMSEDNTQIAKTFAKNGTHTRQSRIFKIMAPEEQQDNGAEQPKPVQQQPLCPSVRTAFELAQGK